MQDFSVNLLKEQEIDWRKCDGLIPAIIQNHHTGKVLMLGYMNKEALKQTLTSGLVTFFSRTKNKLWTKGETSGNTLKLIAISQDCDNDSFLVQVEPQGPCCHKGTESCWSETGSHTFINELTSLIKQRKQESPDQSYTASLFAKGTKRIAQKVGEEGLETALAAATHDKEELINEASDLIYHLLVLLEDQQLTFTDISQNLALRNKQANKASK